MTASTFHEIALNPLLSPEVVVLLAAILAGVGAWQSWRSAARRRALLRGLLAALRGGALLLLGLIALNPGRWIRERLGRDPEWIVLLDRSASMATSDVAGRTRWDEAVRIADRCRREASGSPRLRIRTFASDLEDEVDVRPGERAPDGPTTDMLLAARSLLSRYRAGSRQLTGVILVSDGRQVTPPPSDIAIGREFRAQDAPIFALPIGGSVARRDLSITAARRQYVAFAGQKLRVSATLRNEGLGPLAVSVRLVNAAGAVMEEQKVAIESGASVPVPFDITPESRSAGGHDYAFMVPVQPGEGLSFNNRSGFDVALLENRLRVFVAEGVPNWDSKFLVQLFRLQPTMQVTSVYRLSANRFFEVETELSHVSESDRPVFPDSPADMGRWDVIVIGKGVEYFLTPERIRLLRGFVRDQGGCIVFARGKPYSGALPDLESLEPVTWGDPLGIPCRFRPIALPEAGLFGDMLASADDAVWTRLPPIQFAHRLAGLKAFSQVLAEGVLESGDRSMAVPVIVSRRFGKGMVVTVNAEGLWQWGFFPSAGEATRVYDDLWAQLLLWAATYSEFLPGQDYALRLSEASVLPGVPVSARIARRSPLPAGAPAPTIHIACASNPPQDVAATPVAGADTRWSASVPTDTPGLCRVELVDPSAPSARGPSAILEVRPPPTEADQLSVDRELLATLARDSGGELISPDDLPRVVARLEADPAGAESSRSVWIPLWNTGWLLSGLVGLLAAEWFLRRRNGLL